MAHSHHQLENPFFNRQRIIDPAFFSGRVQAVEQLYSAIITKQSRSIVGERKLGKSSILTHISCPTTLREHGLDPDKFVFVYIDLEGMANITYDEFWPELLDRVEGALPLGETRLREMTTTLAELMELRFMQVRRLLRRVERAGLTLVFMMDEFESLAANADFNASFYGELRSLAGELGVVYLTCSKRSLYDLTYQNSDTLSSPFFNIFSELQMGLMPRPEAIQLIHHLTNLAEAEPFTDQQIDFLIDLAGPHPFFLQVASSYLYAGRNKDMPETDLLTQVERRFRAEAEDHYRYLWDQLSPLEQTALIHLNTANADMKRRLGRKALVWKKEPGRVQPFSRAFASFLARTIPTDRPDRTPGNDSLTGTTLGSYRVLTPIGRGGMAVVYKGYQPTLDRYVAIKVMSRMLIDNEEFLERFQREAAGVAQLRHRNIVQMYDFGMYNDISYMVMEFIDGDTLKDRIKEVHASGQRLPLPEVAHILNDLSAALDYAHAHGVIHRDVKPANIMLHQETRLAELTGGIPFTAVLTDFGVARMLEGVQLTGTGATIGTPDYMSPEQARGEPAGAESDVYSLGILLFEMLTGQLPFMGDSAVATLLQHMQASPPLLHTLAPDVPSTLDAILHRALAKDPAERYSTAGKLAEAFANAISIAESDTAPYTTP